MKLTAPYRCDYCTNTKGQSNHWFLGFVGGFFKLEPWSEKLADMPGFEHICSEACAIKALAKWMGEQQTVKLREGA